MSAGKKLKEATDLLRNIVSLSNSQYSLKCLFESINKAQEWLDNNNKPEYEVILNGIKGKCWSLFEFIEKSSSGLGIIAVIDCGDYRTMMLISTALVQYCNAKMISGTSVLINKDDTLVCIEGKGCCFLSVNYHNISGAANFAGGYMRD